MAKTETTEKTNAARQTVVNRHWNDDGSLTLYVDGRKIARLGGEENEECSEAEGEDPEGYAERYVLPRRFKKATGGWRWGRTTHGHNWHTKKAKAERLRAEREAAAAAQQESVS